VFPLLRVNVLLAIRAIFLFSGAKLSFPRNLPTHSAQEYSQESSQAISPGSQESSQAISPGFQESSQAISPGSAGIFTSHTFRAFLQSLPGVRAVLPHLMCGRLLFCMSGRDGQVARLLPALPRQAEVATFRKGNREPGLRGGAFQGGWRLCFNVGLDGRW
jgi:hypothetical protein